MVVLFHREENKSRSGNVNLLSFENVKLFLQSSLVCVLKVIFLI